MTDARADLPVSPFVIRAPQAAALKDAATIVEDGRKVALQIIEEAKREADAIRDAARVAGRAEAVASSVTLIANTERAMDELRSRQESELVTLVGEMVQKILGRIPPEISMKQLVQTALSDLACCETKTLLIAPGLLSELTKAFGIEAVPGLVMVEDKALTGDELVLIHSRGRMDIGGTAQVQRLLGVRLS